MCRLGGWVVWRDGVRMGVVGALSPHRLGNLVSLGDPKQFSPYELTFENELRFKVYFVNLILQLGPIRFIISNIEPPHPRALRLCRKFAHVKDSSL